MLYYTLSRHCSWWIIVYRRERHRVPVGLHIAERASGWACYFASSCICCWSWIRPCTPRQHDVPATGAGPQVDWPQPGWPLPRERSAPSQQLSPWVPPRASPCLVPWQTSIVCSDERMHAGRYSYWTPALARHWSMFPPHSTAKSFLNGP